VFFQLFWVFFFLCFFEFSDLKVKVFFLLVFSFRSVSGKHASPLVKQERRRGDFWLLFVFLVFFSVLLVFFGDAVDGGFLGDFLDWISWGKEWEYFAGLGEVSGEGKKIYKKFPASARKKIPARKKKEINFYSFFIKYDFSDVG
jgi:hypothetical protein